MNQQGQIRLSKWYNSIIYCRYNNLSDEDEKARIENEIHKIITQRDTQWTKFIEVYRYITYTFLVSNLQTNLQKICSSLFHHGYRY